MEVLILTVFVSVVLVVGELLFFAWNIHHGSHDHTERLSLLPLEDDPVIARGHADLREKADH